MGLHVSGSMIRRMIYQLIAPAFTDEQWFLEHCSLRFNNKVLTRAKKIPRDQCDTFYIDSWAQDSWTLEYGEISFAELRGDRILVSKQDDDGDQLLNFLDSIAARQS
jgi:hypothetical protein